MSKLSIYGTTNAKLRTRLSKLLDDSQVSALIKAESHDEVVAILRSSEYREAAELFAESSDVRRVEQYLFEREIRLFRGMRSELPGNPGKFVEALLVRYEIETLKRVLRTWYSMHIKGRDMSESREYLCRDYSRLRIDDLLQAEDLGAIAELLATTPFGTIVAGVVPASEQRFSLFRLEINLDNYYYAHLDSATKLLDTGDRDIAHRLLNIELDLENLQRIIRLKDLYGIDDEKLKTYLIPSGFSNRAKVRTTSGTSTDIVREHISSNYPVFSPLLNSLGGDRYSNLILLENILHEVLAGEIRRTLRGYPFTLGILLAYFLLIRRETSRIIVILNAKFYGLDEDRVRRLL